MMLVYLHHAVDGVTNVLFGGDEDAADEENHDRGFVVESEHIVVNTNRIKLEEFSKLVKYPQHPESNSFNHLKISNHC